MWQCSGDVVDKKCVRKVSILSPLTAQLGSITGLKVTKQSSAISDTPIPNCVAPYPVKEVGRERNYGRSAVLAYPAGYFSSNIGAISMKVHPGL